LNAISGTPHCSAHADACAPDGFYSGQLTDEDRRALALAANLDGVDAEIGVLRVLIRRVLTAGDVEAARRGIDTLCRTLKIRHALDDQGSGRLADTLGRVLDTLAEEEAISQ
jgi:hypothetical protein